MKIKLDVMVEISRARLAAKGYAYTYGSDYLEHSLYQQNLVRFLSLSSSANLISNCINEI